MFQIEFFETDDGKKPVNEFLRSLDAKMFAKVMRNIEHLKMNGHKVREPLSAPLGDKLFELRTQFGNDITRIIYFFYVGHTIVLTHGFVKKTQKTPQSEISRAKQYQKIYLKRKELENNG